jgi:hypothetical protein
MAGTSPFAGPLAGVEAASGHNPIEGAVLEAALLDLACTVIEALAIDAGSLAAYRALSTLTAEQAQFTVDLLIASFFPDGREDVAALDDAATLCLVALLATSGRTGDAASVLKGAEASRRTPLFLRGAFVARCSMLGYPEGISELWLTGQAGEADSDQARSVVSARPLDIAAHIALVRALAVADAFDAALDALAVALTLPLGDEDKAVLAPDLAALAAVIAARGERYLFARRHVVMALAANAVTAARAVVQLGSAETPLAAAAGSRAMSEAAALLHGYANPCAAAVRSPYPIRNGKPHADIIWLEITNFCNQKCTFCPDMHREDARNWLPLDQIKSLIDEITATVSVGSMQLNAYGEPLLHPHIAEILAYIREKNLPFPTFFTTHGMTLVPKKLAQLSNNYPAGIAVSLHNDSQESYALTRSAKIGDYATLVERLTALIRQMVDERAPTHLRLYQMVSNGAEDMRVDPRVRGAFAPTVDRFAEHLRRWEAIGAEIAAAAPLPANARAIVNAPDRIARSFLEANHGDGIHLPIIEWTDVNGNRQEAFFSPRPVGTYANLLLEYHPDWRVTRQVLNKETCGFIDTPSLAIFATGKLGICCLDLNSTATFTSLNDHESLASAMTSPEAARMFAQLANGVATSRGCQICLSSETRLCG